MVFLLISSDEDMHAIEVKVQGWTDINLVLAPALCGLS